MREDCGTESHADLGSNPIPTPSQAQTLSPFPALVSILKGGGRGDRAVMVSWRVCQDLWKSRGLQLACSLPFFTLLL